MVITTVPGSSPKPPQVPSLKNVTSVAPAWVSILNSSISRTDIDGTPIPCYKIHGRAATFEFCGRRVLIKLIHIAIQMNTLKINHPKLIEIHVVQIIDSTHQIAISLIHTLVFIHTLVLKHIMPHPPNQIYDNCIKFSVQNIFP